MDERQLGGVSRGELERRWALLRSHMRARGIDAILAQSTDTTNSPGSTRWLTDAVGAYRLVVMFFADAPMVVIEHGPQGGKRVLDDDPARPGVGEVHTVAQFPAIAYTQDYEARIVAAVLRERGVRKLGLVNPGIMPHAIVAAVETALAGQAVITDETAFLDMAKAIKSPEEQAMIRRAVAMHDAVFGKLIEKLRPGMRDIDAACIIHDEGRKLGSTHGTILAGSAPPGQPAPILPPHLQGRTIRSGDYMNVLLENTGPGGWFGELARPISFGKASAELLEGFEKVCAAQEETRRRMVAGTRCADIFVAHNAYMTAHGMPAEQRIYAHGQGYDIVERPLIRDDETMVLAPDMFFAVHPLQVNKGLFVFVCDNCFIPASGAPGWEHATARRVFEL